MTKLPIVLVLLFSAFLSQSADARPPKSVLAPPPQPASVTIWEGGCYDFARCTTYEFTITPDNRYQLKAENRVRTPGQTEGRAAGAGFVGVLDALDASKFDALPAKIDRSSGAPCVPHLPGLRVTRRGADGFSKEVFWDQGCVSAEGEQLRDALRAAIGYDELIKPAS